MLLLGSSAGNTAIIVAAEDGAQITPAQVISDSINCVAAVLVYQTQDAQGFCSRVITAMPDESLGYKFRGLSYLLEGRFDKAEPDFHSALGLAPDDPEVQAGYGQSLSGQGRYAAAIPYFDAALELTPDDVRFLAARCWARAGQGGDENLDMALVDCKRASDLAPDYSTAWMNRGLVRLKQRNWRAAIQDYTRSIGNGGESPAALFGRGFAWLQVKEDLQGRADIQAARRLDPTIDQLFIRLGVLPATCRDSNGACPLPSDLRDPRTSEQFARMVSFVPGHFGGLHEMDEYLFRLALGRMDTMLVKTAKLLGTSAYKDFSTPWEDDSIPSALRHLQRVQAEYRRQQDLACAMKVTSGRLCERPNLHLSSALANDPQRARAEVNHTFDAVHPFWQAVCRAKKGSCFLE